MAVPTLFGVQRVHRDREAAASGQPIVERRGDRERRPLVDAQVQVVGDREVAVGAAVIAARHRHAREQLVLDRRAVLPVVLALQRRIRPVGARAWPKLAVPPRISLRCRLPLASSTERLPSRSFHVRVSVAAVNVLKASAKPSAADATYLLAFTLSAVLPVPKRSYAAARRIAQSFQFGTFLTAGRSRAATHRLAGAAAPGLRR